jgi:hypothetical protein
MSEGQSLLGEGDDKKIVNPNKESSRSFSNPISSNLQNSQIILQFVSFGNSNSRKEERRNQGAK